MNSDITDPPRLADDLAISLLVRAFPGEAVRGAVEAAGRREKRARALPADLMVYFAMALWLCPGQGYVRVLRTLLSGLHWAGERRYRHQGLPTDGAISLARYRLGDEPLRRLFHGSAGPVVGEGGSGRHWRGLRELAVDGTVFDLPDCAENRTEYVPSASGARPRARLAVLAESSSTSLLTAAFDSSEVDERALLERLLGRLDAGVILLAGRDFACRELFGRAAATGAQLVWEVPAAFALPVATRLADGTCLCVLPGGGEGAEVTVRVVAYEAAGSGAAEPVRLITTLLDPEAAPAGELARLHARRWRMEALFARVRVDLRTPGGVLRSRAPAGVRQEVWALLCLYQALRALHADPGRPRGARRAPSDGVGLR
ncbi:IS4 family transposase [Streptomyces vinaceus]|uniref:IS4 family transposase n=1 Tax=Streptomyces vinaceus TaxID=1960 RepID=UPI0036742375